MRCKITKAVFPVAGLGTRFLPATKATPKEMLIVVDKPLIQYTVEEAYNSGIRQMIFITSRHKHAIENHFDANHELVSSLIDSEKYDLIALVDKIKPDDMECVYVRQPKSIGLGNSICYVQHLVGEEPFAVLLPDDLLVASPPVIKQMIDLFEQYQCSIIAMQDVPRNHTSRYGIIDGSPLSDNTLHVTNLIEKPEPHLAPSTLAIVGRYILTSSIFKKLHTLQPGSGGEYQLTDALAALLQEEQIIAYRYAGKSYDCGNKLGLLQANVDLGMQHPNFGTQFSSWLACKEL